MVPDFVVVGHKLEAQRGDPRNHGDRLATFQRSADRYIAQRPAFGTAQSSASVRMPMDVGAYDLKIVAQSRQRPLCCGICYDWR